MKFDLVIEGITIEVTQKPIRTLRLTVRPPHGDVRISAPHKVDLETIRNFALSKVDWIRKHQTKLKSRPWSSPLKYVNGEEHWYLGKKLPLEIAETKGKAGVSIVEIPETGYCIMLHVRRGTSKKKCRDLLEEWYRLQLKEIIPAMVKKHETAMGVHAEEWIVKKMKTKWGTCNIIQKKIRLNLELSKKPIAFIEHVVVHELVHLLERKHNARFKGLMDLYLPGWRSMHEQGEIDE